MRFPTALIALFAVIVSGQASIAETGVGVRSIVVQQGERQSALKTMVWYPVNKHENQPGATEPIGDNAVFLGTSAQRDVAIAKGRFPLVLIAHGGFRAAPNVASWLASALVKRGFVAVMTHPPAIPDGMATQAVLSELWLRPADLSATVTAIETDPALRGRVDRGRVGAIGVFLGGYSVLQLVGARVDKNLFVQSCEGSVPAPDCAWFARGNVDLHQIDAVRLERSNHDPRVKVAVVIDPELTGTLTALSLKAISVPVHIVSLGKQETIPRALNASNLQTKIPGSEYTLIEDASSFSSFNECKPRGPVILKSEGGAALCDDGGGRTRAKVHAELAGMIANTLLRSLSLEK